MSVTENVGTHGTRRVACAGVMASAPAAALRRSLGDAGRSRRHSPPGTAEQRSTPPAHARRSPAAAAQPQPAGATGTARRQPPRKRQPTFRGGIDFVRVDVIVTRQEGQPVTDLKQADFEVLEDGKPQTIEQFRLVSVDGNPSPVSRRRAQIRNRDDERREAAREDVRVCS